MSLFTFTSPYFLWLYTYRYSKHMKEFLVDIYFNFLPCNPQ